MPRKNSLISVAFEGPIATFTVGDAGSFTVDASALTDDIRLHATLHGIKQKVSDAAAMPKEELTGNAKKDAATKFEAMKSVAESIMAGEWSKRRGDGTGPVAGILFRAYEEFVTTSFEKAKKPVPDAETIRAKFDALGRGKQLALRNTPGVMEIIERLKSERAIVGSSINTTELLGELGL